MAKTGETIKAKVISAAPLSAGQRTALEGLLIDKLDMQVEVAHETDASLIGGFYIVVGDLVIDTSVKKQINDMKECIMRGVL